ncbi:MAG TPA: SgcJ/EcaC family oxidoreductase [Cyclobacteriaceae bacterium]|nr:SgcJ/EcaC family oxidoreductase [Cyclobacteriaceae bacterium]
MISPATIALIVSLETAALEKWNNGDPSGYLDLSADDVVYFDPETERRLDGKKALTRYYEPFIGKIKVIKYEMQNVKVQGTDEVAVLTFNLFSYTEEKLIKWNCTEVYQLRDGAWKIIQTHWSFTKAPF